MSRLVNTPLPKRAASRRRTQVLLLQGLWGYGSGLRGWKCGAGVMGSGVGRPPRPDAPPHPHAASTGLSPPGSKPSTRNPKSFTRNHNPEAAFGRGGRLAPPHPHGVSTGLCPLRGFSWCWFSSSSLARPPARSAPPPKTTQGASRVVPGAFLEQCVDCFFCITLKPRVE